MKWFKRKAKKQPDFKVKLSTSCEDSNKQYLTFPDGLRLIVDDGKYVGWYVSGVEEV